MNALPLPHSAELLAAGYHALGKIQSPECATHYFVHPTDCRLAFVSAGRGHTKLRAYDAHPLEILAVATLCLAQQTTDRAEAVRVAREQLSRWGLHMDRADPGMGRAA